MYLGKRVNDLEDTFTGKLDSLREISLLGCPRLESEFFYFGVSKAIPGEDGRKFQDGFYDHLALVLCPM